MSTEHACVFFFLFPVFINNYMWLGVSCLPPRWTERLLFVVITSTTSRSTTDSRSAIRQYPSTAHQHSVLRSVMSWLSVNADHSQRLFASMSSARKSNVLKVTSRRLSSSSEEWNDVLLGFHTTMCGVIQSLSMVPWNNLKVIRSLRLHEVED